MQLSTNDVYSQFGEDGLIQGIFDHIGIVNKWCFEVGAADGEWLSNTKLWRDRGWSALLVESEPKAFSKLKRFENERVRCVCEHVGPDSLDRLLAIAGAPIDLDLGVIDVDGQDWWILDGLKNFKPRVLMVEFSQTFDAPIPKLGGAGQACKTHICELAATKGYRLVAETLVNALFVREELWKL